MTVGSKARWASRELWPFGHIALLLLLTGLVAYFVWHLPYAILFTSAGMIVMATGNLWVVARRKRLPAPPA